MSQGKPKPPPTGPELQFGAEDKQPSAFNRIAASGINFVRDVLDMGTSRGVPSLDLGGEPEAGSPSFSTDEVSRVNQYTPTWEGGGQALAGAKQQQEQPPEEFTKFNSAIRAWDAHQADRAFTKKKRHKVVYRSAPRRSPWRLFFTLLFVSLLAVGGLYTYRFVTTNLVSDLKARVGQRGDKMENSDKKPKNEDSVKGKTPVRKPYKKRKKGYNSK